MKIDDMVLYAVAAFAVVGVVLYLGALVVGVIHTGGILLPVLAIGVGALAVFLIVLRQRLSNPEDDHYENIER